jgi:PST family polysaccharide transporter
MKENDITSLAKRSIHGVLILISRQFALNIISFVAFLFVTAILSPNDIGIFTAIIAIQRIISFFTDFGFGAALIQKKDALTDKDITTTFTLQAGVTLSIFILVFAFQDALANIFGYSDVGKYLLLSLVFTIFLSSFKTIPAVMLERGINFGKLVIPQIVESLVFNILLVVLVVQGFGIESFTWAFLISGLAGIPFYYMISPWKARIGIHKSSLTHLKFGIQFQAKSILATIKDDLLTAFLPKFISYAEIGYIGFAQRLAFFIYRYVVDSLTKVTFSSYSRMQGNTDFLKKAIEKSLFFVAATMFPLLVGLIITIPYVIDYFPRWDNKWEPAVMSVMFFSLNALLSSVSGVLVNVLDASGKVTTTLRLMVVWTVLTWTLTPVAIMIFGYNGVAIASFLISLSLVYTIYLVRKIVMFSVSKPLIKPIFATAVMGIFTYVGSELFVSNIFSLIVLVVISGVIYCGAMYLTAKDEIIHDVRKFILKK